MPWEELAYHLALEEIEQEEREQDELQARAKSRASRRR